MKKRLTAAGATAVVLMTALAGPAAAAGAWYHPQNWMCSIMRSC